jgi:hypothetical protein
LIDGKQIPFRSADRRLKAAGIVSTMQKIMQAGKHLDDMSRASLTIPELINISLQSPALPVGSYKKYMVFGMRFW